MTDCCCCCCCCRRRRRRRRCCCCCCCCCCCFCSCCCTTAFVFWVLSISNFKSIVYRHQKLCPQYCRLLSVVIILLHLQTFITDPAILFYFNLGLLPFIAFCVFSNN